MSSFFDMISAFIAMLMSAAFLHFGASGDSPPVVAAAPASNALASSATPAVDPVVDDGDDAAIAPVTAPAVHHHARRLAAHCHGHDVSGGAPAMVTVRAPSPLRRG